MKNQYFADINDYRKYGLIRALVVPGGLTVGVIWMLTPDDDRSDGQFTGFWRDASARRHDPQLYDLLVRCRDGAPRSVSLAEAWDLIPQTSYASELLHDHASARDAYFRDALRVMNGVDLLFFDPDNGLEVSSVPRGRRKSSKYLYWSEVDQAFATGASLLVYQHFQRRERSQFAAELAGRINQQLNPAAVVSFATAHVLFLLAVQQRHVEALELGIRRVADAWTGQIRIQRHVA